MLSFYDDATQGEGYLVAVFVCEADDRRPKGTFLHVQVSEGF
jgi:hypothetical protein